MKGIYSLCFVNEMNSKKMSSRKAPLSHPPLSGKSFKFQVGGLLSD